MNVTLSSSDCRLLLYYAEDALRAVVNGTQMPPLPDLTVLDERYGAFCTLKRENALRGCIGNFANVDALRQVLPRVIREAAFHDPRFAPVATEELPGISVSLSFLFPARDVELPESIELGKDGVILSVGTRRAVFLPEVATEQGWDRATMLDALCRKGGLPPKAWTRRDARLEVFRTMHIFRSPMYPDRIVVNGGER